MTTTGPVGVGIIGAGKISDEYLASLTKYPDVVVVGVADIDLERAKAQAEAFGVGFSGSTEELLAREDVELVVNLTIPAVHAEVALTALAAGKHVWGEKPLTLDRASARRVLDTAEAAGLIVGNAPDTIIGRGIQHAQQLVADGTIGTPQTVLTLMQSAGPDSWHPRPQFLFEKGAGPLLDIGPYYFTTLVQILGEIDSVQAIGHRAYDVRIVPSGPRKGQEILVEVFTHVSVLTRFASGVVGTGIFSFDSALSRQLFEITGSEGTITVPVFGFEGSSQLLPRGSADQKWQDIELVGTERDRGAGVLEMARAIRAGRQALASGELAFHVLDTMLAVEESMDAGIPIAVTSHIGAVPPLDPAWDPAERTL